MMTYKSKNRLKLWGKRIAIISGIAGGVLTVAGAASGAWHWADGYLAAQRAMAVAVSQRNEQIVRNTTDISDLRGGLRRIENGVSDLHGEVKGLSGKVDVLLRLNGGAPGLPKNRIALGPEP